MRFSTGHRISLTRTPSADLARATIAAIDAASATVDDIARARAFERAMHDAQAIVRALAAERQHAVLAALSAGMSIDTIAVQLGTDRLGIQAIVDDHRTDARAQFEQSAPVRWG